MRVVSTTDIWVEWFVPRRTSATHHTNVSADEFPSRNGRDGDPSRKCCAVSVQVLADHHGEGGCARRRRQMQRNRRHRASGKRVAGSQLTHGGSGPGVGHLGKRADRPRSSRDARGIVGTPGSSTGTAADASPAAPKRRRRPFVAEWRTRPRWTGVLLTLALGLIIAALSVRHHPTNAQSQTNHRRRRRALAAPLPLRAVTARHSRAERFFPSTAPPPTTTTTMTRRCGGTTQSLPFPVPPPRRRRSVMTVKTHGNFFTRNLVPSLSSAGPLADGARADNQLIGAASGTVAALAPTRQRRGRRREAGGDARAICSTTARFVRTGRRPLRNSP